MERIYKTTLAVLAIALSIPAMAQNKVSKDTVQSANSNREAQSMLLNASSADSPREINIGLPSDLGGTTILENGIPVTYDYQSQAATRVWRQDGSFSKVQSLNIFKTAVKNGSIGIAMSTESGKGTKNFQAQASFQTNTFGLVRVNGKISGPIKNGWYYQLSGFLNYDPTSQRQQFSRFNDQTQIFRGFINKKYRNGEIGLQYKFAHSQGVTQWNVNPYIYHSDGTVDEYNGMNIGTTMYAEKTGRAHPHDIWTGEQYDWDILKETGSDSHIFDILGNHFFNNKMKFHYALRLHFANSGFYNPNYGTIFNTETQGDANRYVYQENPELVYTGMVQKGQTAIADKWSKFGMMLRAELSKKSGQHDWLVGLSADGLDADNAYRAVYGTYMTVEENPSMLVHQKLVDGVWVNSSDEWGDENPNSAIQYYDGLDSKFALYGTDKWNIVKHFTVDLGTRFEWQHIDGYWAPQSCRGKNEDGWNVLTGREKLQKDWFHWTGSANFVWNFFKGGGLTADAMFAQTGGNLSGYCQAVDPDLKTSNTMLFSVGFYYNSPKFDITSKINYITRDNYSFAGNFENPSDVTEITRLTVKYGVETLGWTTDLNWRPFKGFSFHYLLTLQDPKYKDFDFTAFDQQFSYSDCTVRNVSKVLMEFDPAYKFGKWRVWLSARYYSKMYACFSNALYFASRWETFGGLDYTPSKNVKFSMNVVNILNQTGAQGNIAGANTITKERASEYYDQPLACTYIRPFQIEFKTTFKF
ncbi:MAG: hypothetical protein ACOYJG_04195 [Prevotella sp.]|jgi:hypothetical protein